MADDLSDLIAEAAAAPAKMTVSAASSSAEAHPLTDVIAADKHLSATRAAAKTHFGLRFVRLDFPGAG